MLSHTIDIKPVDDNDDLILRINKAVDYLEGLQNLSQEEAKRINSGIQRPATASVYTNKKRCAIFLHLCLVALGIYGWIDYGKTKDDSSAYAAAGISVYVLMFFILFSKNLKNIKSSAAANLMDSYLLEDEKRHVHQILFDLEITLENYKLSELISFLKQKKKDLVSLKHNPSRKIAFLMGQHSRAGAESAVKKFFFESDNYDENLTDLIFQFAGFSEFSIKEKKEEVKKLLSFSIFNNNENEMVNLINPTEKEKIVNEILSY